MWDVQRGIRQCNDSRQGQIHLVNYWTSQDNSHHAETHITSTQKTSLPFSFALPDTYMYLVYIYVSSYKKSISKVICFYGRGRLPKWVIGHQAKTFLRLLVMRFPLILWEVQQVEKHLWILSGGKKEMTSSFHACSHRHDPNKTTLQWLPLEQLRHISDLIFKIFLRVLHFLNIGR